MPNQSRRFILIADKFVLTRKGFVELDNMGTSIPWFFSTRANCVKKYEDLMRKGGAPSKRIRNTPQDKITIQEITLTWEVI